MNTVVCGRANQPSRLRCVCLILFVTLLLAQFFSAESHAGTPPIFASPSEREELTTIDYTRFVSVLPQLSESNAIGHIWYNGTAVSDAQVTIQAHDGDYINTTTKTGPLSPDPYFSVDLSAPPLNAEPEDILKLLFSYQGEENLLAFIVKGGEQDLNGYLSSTCGPTVISSGLIGVDTTWTPECGPYQITSNLKLLATKTLNILPGTTVQFAPDRMMWTEGILNVDGLPNALVTFTARDTTLPGEWGYLHLNDDTGAGSVLSYILLEYAGGLEVVNNAALRIEGGKAEVHNTIVRDSTSDGVQIYNDASVRMHGLWVTDNTGWGVYVDSKADHLGIYTSTIQSNGEGGIWVYNTDTITITNNQIANNLDHGVQIDRTDNLARITENIIRANQSKRAGGILFGSTARGYIQRNWIIENNTTKEAGGIRVALGSTLSDFEQVIISRNFIISNQTTETSGGGIYFSPATYVSGDNVAIFRNIITDNHAQLYGGGIFHNYYHVNAQYNTLVNNSAGENGAAIHGYNHLLTLQHNVITANTAESGGGAVYLDEKLDDPVSFNSMHANQPFTLFYAAEDAAENDLDASGNWWGEITPDVIPPQIWDKFDDGSLAEVNFVPWLLEPNLNTPLLPPTGVAAVNTGSTITVTWGLNAEPDLAGYKLYFSNSDNLSITAALGEVTGVDVGLSTGAMIFDVPPGIYSLAVTAYDSGLDGVDDWTDINESWLSEVQNIQIGENPHASFSAAPTNGVTPLTVDFTDTSTGDFTSWLWDFGDEAISTDQHPSHTFLVPGSYTVTLTVDGPLGFDTLIMSDYILVDQPGSLPTASFSAAPTNGIAPLTVDFTDTSTGDFTSWLWDFGDEAISTDQHPSHTYTISGVYTVSLTVDGSFGSDVWTEQDCISVQGQIYVYIPLVFK